MSDPHVFTLKELGGMYFPSASQSSRSKLLKRWIMRNKALRDRLNECGFKIGQRYLTPRQVELIYEFLGEP